MLHNTQFAILGHQISRHQKGTVIKMIIPVFGSIAVEATLIGVLLLTDLTELAADELDEEDELEEFDFLECFEMIEDFELLIEGDLIDGVSCRRTLFGINCLLSLITQK